MEAKKKQSMRENLPLLPDEYGLPPSIDAAGFAHALYGEDRNVARLQKWLTDSDIRFDNPVMQREHDRVRQSVRCLIDEHNQSFTDELTGLPKQVILEDRLHEAIEFIKRTEKDPSPLMLGILYLDLDDFKPINDTYGHSAGNVVLRTVAERLKQCTRSGGDTVSRLHGDEFVVLLRGIRNPQEAEMKADHLRKLIAKPIRYEDAELTVHASIGIGVFPSEELRSNEMAETLMHRILDTSDKHMLKEKKRKNGSHGKR